MIKVIALLILSFCSLSGSSQGKSKKSPVEWLTVQQAQNLLARESRPVLVDVYTNWCHYCKVMDATAWSDPDVKAYLDRYFYPVKFNAEGKEPVVWQGVVYEYRAGYEVHMLAAEWLRGNMVYPSMVIIPPGGAEAVVVPGVVNTRELEPILTYFGEKHYLHTAWADYKASFKNKW